MLASRYGVLIRNSKWNRHVRLFQPQRALPPDEPRNSRKSTGSPTIRSYCSWEQGMQMVFGPRVGLVERSAAGMLPSLRRTDEDEIRGPEHSRPRPGLPGHLVLSPKSVISRQFLTEYAVGRRSRTA